MSLRLAIAPSLLRAAAAALADLLRIEHRATAQTQPGRLLQPKHIFRLDADTVAPDGLSAAYLALAADRNSAARAPQGELPDLLLSEIEAELCRAVVLEARILARLGEAR